MLTACIYCTYVKCGYLKWSIFNVFRTFRGILASKGSVNKHSISNRGSFFYIKPHKRTFLVERNENFLSGNKTEGA